MGMKKEELMDLSKEEIVDMLLKTNASIEELQKQNKLMAEQIAVMNQRMFGRSSEKHLTKKDEMEGQMAIEEGEEFNEAEAETDKAKEEETEQITYTRKKHKGKREMDLSTLPHEDVQIELSEEELKKEFPDGKYKKFESYTYQQVEYKPAVYKVLVNHVYAYSDGEKIVKAPHPTTLLRNSIVTPSLEAGIINIKYGNSVPIHRLQQDFESRGFYISTQDMCYWTNEIADRYFKRVYDRLKDKLMGYHVIHADETPVEVRKDGRPTGSRSYMWVYRSGALEKHPFVLYEYQKTRASDHPREFLKDFKGYCVTDGYAAYHKIDGEREDLKIAGCWAHAKRGFSEIVKSLEKGKTDTISYKALTLIDQMFEEERQYKDLSPQERLEERQKTIAPQVDAFFAWLQSVYHTVASKSAAGRAVHYCLTQERYLRVFLTDGMIPMTNNAAERSIRNFTQGRKNWYLIDTVSGAQASAILYSMVETAKQNNLNVYNYLKYLLEELPKHGEFEDPSYIDDLLPWSEKIQEGCRKQERPKVTEKQGE